MNKSELSAVLDSHEKWLTNVGGERAVLHGVDLRGANLFRADLRKADLCKADLRQAELSRAILFEADLSGANLFGADLSGANLFGADLSRADLFGANLSRANLSRANLCDADLFRADLSSAKGIILLPVQDMRGYSFAHAIKCNDEWRIRAGCRDFTIAEARAHWGHSYTGYREQGDMYLYAIEWLEKKLRSGEFAAESE